MPIPGPQPQPQPRRHWTSVVWDGTAALRALWAGSDIACEAFARPKVVALTSAIAIAVGLIFSLPLLWFRSCPEQDPHREHEHTGCRSMRTARVPPNGCKSRLPDAAGAVRVAETIGWRLDGG